MNEEQIKAAKSPPPMFDVTPPPKSPPRVYTLPERLLLLIALAIGILFDRLVIANIDGANSTFFYGVFWLGYVVLFYIFNWKKLKNDRLMWLVAGLTVLLCAWNFIFDFDSSYGGLTVLVIPCVLMAHAVFVGSGCELKQAGKLAQDWLCGWFIKPFSAIPRFFGAAASLFATGKNSKTKRVIIGIVIIVPIMLIILPLLAGADKVFKYYVDKIFSDFILPEFVGHLITICIITILFFSFFWNIRFNKPREAAVKNEAKIDSIITAIVLGAVLIVYVLFCIVQFTYLFARAGLPADMTYSTYAVEGFWQLILITGINLLIFGVFLQFGQKCKALTASLVALLAVTIVILISSAVRLSLYTNAYGLTWLRLLSAWFICYLTVVIILSAVRLARESLPLIAVAAIILLGWYVVLGYSNPDAMIMRYNLSHTESVDKWFVDNDVYFYSMSDDAMLAILKDNSTDFKEFKSVAQDKLNDSEGISLSSRIMRAELEARGFIKHK